MKATATCSTCGGEISGGTTPLGVLCPACVIRASFTPFPTKEGPLTTWAEVFPQLEVERTLREEPGLSVYLTRVVDDHETRRAILQVASGCRLLESGGTRALTARSQRLGACDFDGLAPVLDFGDLADAFFLVTEAPSLPRVPEALEGKAADELSLLVRAVTDETEAISRTGRAIGISLRGDPDLCFVDPQTARVVVTPSLLPFGGDPVPDSANRPELVPGKRVGAFLLEEVIGEGGFGTVWRARQERPVERKVAVKVLKAGLHSQRARARFEIEQQALARLDHPHIARFLDGGTTPAGRPYFAMEWIEGHSLADFVKETGASLEERLHLFHQVVGAVHFAHQKGIIHRDLKPSNVMVTLHADVPSAKVIDFGIARTLADPADNPTQLTRAEELLGTPAAMSPEQAAGAGGADLDARTDVYGLGVLLYELVTGALPFDPKLPADELRRRIREDDPPKPSSRIEDKRSARALRGELDWISMRCLEKDPERRYRSASALLRDLERHAAHEPVDAGPPAFAYRARKFVRRNRAVVAGSLVALVALVAGLALALDGYRRASGRAVEAQQSREEAEREAALSAQVKDFLQENFFGLLNPNNNTKAGLTLEEAVTRAAEALEARPFDAPQVEGEVRLTLAQSLEGIANYEKAEHQFRLAARKLTEGLGPDADRSLEASAGRARVLSRLGRHKESCALQEDVVARWAERGGRGEDHLRARWDLATYLMAAYRLRDGVELLEAVHADQRERYGPNHVETLASLTDLSRFYADVDKDFARAKRLRGGLDVKIYRNGSVEAIGLLHAVYHLGINNEQLAVLEERLAGMDQGNEGTRLDALRLRVEYARALNKRGEHHAAIDACEPVLADLEAALGPTHPTVLDAYEVMTWALFRAKQRDRIPSLVEPVLARLDEFPERAARFPSLAMRFYSLLGRWGDLAQYCDRVAPRLGLEALRQGIAAAIGAGDREIAERLRAEVVKRFGDTDDPYAAATIAECLLNTLLLTTGEADPELLDQIGRYVAIADAQLPNRGKTRVAGFRLALARRQYEDAARLAKESSGALRGRGDVFDDQWYGITYSVANHHLGHSRLAAEMLRRCHRFWSSTQFGNLRHIWWDSLVPIAAGWDWAEYEVRGEWPAPPRHDPDRFGVSASAYNAYWDAVDNKERAVRLRREAWEALEGGGWERAKWSLIETIPWSLENAAAMELLQVGTVLAVSGDTSHYEQFCAELIERFGSLESDWTRLERMALALLMRSGDPDSDRLAYGYRMMEESFRLREGSQGAWTRLGMARAEYRAGRYPESAERLAEIRGFSAPGFQEEVFALRAMVAYRLGREDEARVYLDVSRVLLSAWRGEFLSIGVEGQGWHDVLGGALLLREAESLIEGRTPAADPVRALIATREDEVVGLDARTEETIRRLLAECPVLDGHPVQPHLAATALRLAGDARHDSVQRIFAQLGAELLAEGEKTGDTPHALFRTATVLAMGPSGDAFDEFSDRMIELFADSDDAVRQHRVWLNALLRPGVDRARCRRAMQLLVDHVPDGPLFRNWTALARVLAAYRAEDFAAAREVLDQVERPIPDGMASKGTLNLLFDLLEAMVEKGRGNHQRAQEILDEARVNVVVLRQNNPVRSPTLEQWQDILRCEILLEEAEALIPEERGPDDPTRWEAERRLATACFKTGDYTEAIRIWGKLIERMEAAGIMDAATQVDVKTYHAVAHSHLGRDAEAIALLEPLVAEFESRLPEDRFAAPHLRNLTALYGRCGMIDEAIEVATRWYSRSKRISGPGDRETLRAAQELSTGLILGGEFERALPILEDLTEQRTAYERHVGYLFPFHHVQNLIGATIRELGRTGEAVRHWREVLTERLASGGPGDVEAFRAEILLGEALSLDGQHQEAIEILDDLLERELTAKMPWGTEGSQDRAGASMQKLALAYRRAGQQSDYKRMRKTLHSHTREVLEGEYEEALLDAGESAQVLIDIGARWRWARPEGVPPELYQQFAKAEFDDSGWSEGADSLLGGFAIDEDGLIDGEDLGWDETEWNLRPVLFRHRFTTDRPFERLELHVSYDDGLVVFVDGEEVTRANVPDLPLSEDLRAMTKHGGLERIVLPVALEPGEHVLAISLHQAHWWVKSLRLSGIRLVGIPRDSRRK